MTIQPRVTYQYSMPSKLKIRPGDGPASPTGAKKPKKIKRGKALTTNVLDGNDVDLRKGLPPWLESHKWKPGNAPKGGAYTKTQRQLIAECRALCNESSVDATNALIELMKSEDHRVRFLAIKEVLDRAGVRPPPENEKPKTRPDLSKLSAADQAALGRILGRLASDDAAAPIVDLQVESASGTDTAAPADSSPAAY